MSAQVKNILIYFPYNQRTVEQQSVMEWMVQQGHRVFLLTLSPEDRLHDIVRGMGVTATASPAGEISGIGSIISNARYLMRFCRQNRIDILFAHQQLCALPAIFAAPFIKARWYYTRHNTDEGYDTGGRKTRLLNRFIQFFARQIIAPSERVYSFLQQTEKVPGSKLRRINYGYNFSQYELPDPVTAAAIRQQYPAQLLLISIARMIPAKRHQLMFDVVKQLREKGLDCRLICLGDGALRGILEEYIAGNELTDAVTLLGRRDNIMDYLSAADILLHLSESEASNSVVKEAALAGLPALVCKQVGDFDDYIKTGINGCLLDKKEPVNEAVSFIEDCYKNPDKCAAMGKQAAEIIQQQFSIGRVTEAYTQIINHG